MQWNSDSMRSATQDTGVFEAVDSLRRTAADGAGLKALASTVMAVAGQIVGAVDEVVLFVLTLWALDMVAGTVRALHERGMDGMDAGKARSGFLRGVIYLVAVAAASVAASLSEALGGPNLMPGAVWAVCGWVAVAELGSIGRHLNVFYPGLGSLLRAITSRLPINHASQYEPPEEDP